MLAMICCECIREKAGCTVSLKGGGGEQGSTKLIMSAAASKTGSGGKNKILQVEP
jgi:hypothetical protein